jgi:hypothetical protein
MAHLGWRLPTFVNVRRRLETILRRVPGDLLGAAFEVLSRDGGPPAASVGRRADRIVEITADGGDTLDESTDTIDDSTDSSDGTDDGQEAA